MSYIRRKGIKRAVHVLYYYKIDIIERKLLSVLFWKAKLKNIIVIESHNDFDCNGGALYDYLIKSNKNTKYKIVWLIKNSIPDCLPCNVMAFKINHPSLRKNYCITRAKFLFFDEKMIETTGKDQTSVYLTHGGVTFKNVKGTIIVPDHITYILSPSTNYDKLMCENYSIPFPNKRMLHFGMPKNDCLFSDKSRMEINKITNISFSNIILWMPTFRKMAKSERNDSSKTLPYGLPLLYSSEDIRNLDKTLIQTNTFLIIKLHPNHDLGDVPYLSQTKNIILLTDMDCKKLKVNTYRLMTCASALISDYSSSAYSFLLLNKPIGFALDDLQEYSRGFLISDYRSVLPGSILYSMNDFVRFITELSKGIDEYQIEREKLIKWLYEFQDGDSCKRLIEYLGI